jgi:hypothetical protein
MSRADAPTRVKMRIENRNPRKLRPARRRASKTSGRLAGGKAADRGPRRCSRTRTTTVAARFAIRNSSRGRAIR